MIQCMKEACVFIHCIEFYDSCEFAEVAEVEWTLQKGGDGFEFAIKIIAYQPLSPSLSPLKSISFTKPRHFVIFDHVDGQFVPD